MLFAARAGKPIVYLDRPLTRWLDRPGRFHAGMTVENQLNGDARVMRDTCAIIGIELEEARLRATLVLRGFFLAGLGAGLRLARRTAGEGRISWSWLLRLAMRRLAFSTPWMVTS